MPWSRHPISRSWMERGKTWAYFAQPPRLPKRWPVSRTISVQGFLRDVGWCFRLGAQRRMDRGRKLGVVTAGGLVANSFVSANQLAELSRLTQGNSDRRCSVGRLQGHVLTVALKYFSKIVYSSGPKRQLD